MLRHRRLRLALLVSLAAASSLQCTSSKPGEAPADAGAPAPPDAGGGPFPPTAIGDLPVDGTLSAPGLSAPVDVVRDDMGIPHVFAANVADAAQGQGYVMAQDRWVQMDFARRQAQGTLAEIVGGLSPAALRSDLVYRAHHFRATAERTLAALLASQDPADRAVAAALGAFAAGVNAWQADLRAGKVSLPSELALAYDVGSVTPWSAVDSLVLGDLQAFSLSFDAASEIARSYMMEMERTAFVGSSDAAKAARVGFAADYDRPDPIADAFTVDGWSDVHPVVPAAQPLVAGPAGAPSPPPGASAAHVRLLREVKAALTGIGVDRVRDPSRGSNNWVVGGARTTSGRPIVANDTHLSLGNPATFYLNHVVTKDGLDVMGVQFPGIPFVVLGMNRHVAWGSTVSYIDVTDVYDEALAPCGDKTCVKFKGGDVPLTVREEKFAIGLKGAIESTITQTYYDVPHHGPLLPRVNADGKSLAAPGAKEMSVRWTGHAGGPLARAIYDLGRSANVDDAVRALNAHFTHGGQNWVLADDAGNIAWTQAVRVPRRPKGTKPWLVLPGDGSAEWDGFFAPQSLPQAKNPARGYLATANADPLGVTRDGDPSNEPSPEGAGGSPLYLGYNYDPGTRVARIQKRIEDGSSNGKKLDMDAMASIQADAFSEWGRMLNPTLVAALEALAEEAQSGGTHADLTALLAAASPAARAALLPARDAARAWSYDTPSATADEAPTPAQLTDSRATLLFHAWVARFAQAAIGDELAVLDTDMVTPSTLKLLVAAVTDPSKIRTGSVLFDDLTTPAVLETKSVVAAKAALGALDFVTAHPKLGADPAAWRWGAVHTLGPSFYIPIGLDLPARPRHGGIGTVDVASPGLGGTDFAFGSGPAIRFVCEVDPATGPRARNVLPGGETFAPTSPHYADQFARWVKNEAPDLAYAADDVAVRARAEKAAHGAARVRFVP